MAIEKDVLDQLLLGRDPGELFSKDGLIDELKKALSERILSAELDDHLETETAEGVVNRRNGSSKKTVLTGSSKVTLAVPRDRAGTFDPKLIAKYQRRFPDFDDKIVSMYARGMTVREIRGHLEELYGIDVSPDLISSITDAVLETVAEWQGRPLDTCFPLVFFDAIRSRSATKASSATRQSTSRWGSNRTAPRRSWGSGSSRPRAPNSGCAS
jgi:putative transposase